MSHTTKPKPKRTLSASSADGPDPSLKATKASDTTSASAAATTKKPKLRSSRKTVRVVSLEEEPEAVVEETSQTKGGNALGESKEKAKGEKELKSALKASKSEPLVVVKKDGKTKGKNRESFTVAKEVAEEEEDLLTFGDEAEGGESEGEDSSDEEEEDGDYGNEEDALPLDSVELPEVQDGGKRSAKLDKAKKAKPNPGIVYLGRIPHGFHEAEMMSYFSQFGSIRRLRLSRNRKTGKSKHYAFIEFTHKEVAEVVVDTMNGYLLKGRLLTCSLIEGEVDRKMWIGAGKKFRPDQSQRMAREKHNEEKDADQQSAIAARLVRRESSKRKRISDMGIEYDFPGYAATSSEASSAAASKSTNGAEPAPTSGEPEKKRKSKKAKVSDGKAASPETVVVAKEKKDKKRRVSEGVSEKLRPAANGHTVTRAKKSRKSV